MLAKKKNLKWSIHWKTSWSRTDASIKVTLKVSGATGFLIENRIADKITKVFRRLPQITSKIVANEKELDREISKERYIAI